MSDYLIRRLEASGALSDASRDALAKLCSNIRTVPARQYIVREGDCPVTVPVMLEGWAARYKMLEDGRRQITAFMIPGDHGDRRRFLMRNADHSIVTLKPCVVGFALSRDIERLIEQYPDMARAFSWSALVEETTLRSWVVNVGRRVSFERIGHLMCEMHVRMDAVGLAKSDGNGGSVFDFPLTQEDLADTVGLTPVHTNRVLQRLRSERLIHFQSRSLKILDLKRLRTVSGFDLGYLHLSCTEDTIMDSRTAA